MRVGIVVKVVHANPDSFETRCDLVVAVLLDGVDEMCSNSVEESNNFFRIHEPSGSVFEVEINDDTSPRHMVWVRQRMVSSFL